MNTKSQHKIDFIIDDLDKKVDLIFRHNNLLNDYSNTPRDYGVGFLMSEIEIHTLGYICDKEGITVTQLALDNCRTKSYISQLVTRLESKGLVQRKKEEGNKKTAFLYPTDEGKKVCSIHRAYDRTKSMDMINKLLLSCTTEEIEGFYKVLALRIQIFEEEYHEKLNK